MQKREFEEYRRLRTALEERAVELCHIYAEEYYDLDHDERDIVVTNLEVGRSGRILIQYTCGDIEEMLYLPPEYLWRTNEEVRVLMGRDRARKEAHLRSRRGAGKG
ncbi:MAG: hypothetical protein K9L28_06660 [Synergistales bacterium]|nr:hypothetical protein [Synergistales bacterium]